MSDPQDRSRSEPPSATGDAFPEQHQDRSDELVRTRTSGVWTGVVLAVLLAIAIIIFILQNSQKVEIQWLGIHVHTPMAVALLIATVGGAAITVLAGGARIVQLRVARRRAARAHRNHH